MADTKDVEIAWREMMLARAEAHRRLDQLKQRRRRAFFILPAAVTVLVLLQFF